MEDIIKAILALLFGALFGYAVFKIAVTVKEVITKSNLSRIVRKVLNNSSNKKIQKWLKNNPAPDNIETRKQLAAALTNAAIKDIENGNVVSIALLENGKTIGEVTIKGQGISEELKPGMAIAV